MFKFLLLFALALVLTSIPGDALGENTSALLSIHWLVVWLWTSPGSFWFLLKTSLIALWLGGVVLILWAGVRLHLAHLPISSSKRFN
jgi:hypothetical protein